MRRNQLMMVPLVLGTALGVAWLAAGHTATPDHADHQNTEDADGMMGMSPHMDMDDNHMDNRDGMDGMRHMDDDDHMAQMRERMQQMHQRMAEAQTTLAPDLRIVNDAVFVTRGEHLLRYDLDLELTQTAARSDADAKDPEP